MLARWLLLLVVGSSRLPWKPVLAALAEGDARGVLDCGSDGSEDWPSVQRRLFRLLEGEIPGDALSSELERAATPAEQLGGDCAPGLVSLRILLLLTTPGVPLSEVASFLTPEWKLLGVLGWPAVVRTGWPVFKLLRMLQHHCKATRGEAVPGCEDTDEPFAALLSRHVQRHRVRAGESLLASGAKYLHAHGESSGGCPLSVAAAYLAMAWLRYPVYDSETEDLLRLAEPLVSSLELEQVLSTRHALVDMLADVAGAYQAFLIDSGALYKDLRPKEILANTVDYTRHMMSGPAAGEQAGGLCSVASARTPVGRCNPFAPLGPGLTPWRRRGVALEDTLRAFRLRPLGAPLVLLRVVGSELQAMLPRSPPSLSEAAALCLAEVLLALGERARLPSVDVVVRLGGWPFRRRPDDMDSDRVPEDDAPLPLFSTCAREGWWDVALPRLCGVRCLDRDPAVGSDGDDADVAEEAVVSPLTPVPPVPANTSGGAEDEAVLCYMFRLVLSYAEMLLYEPAHGQIPRSYVSSFRSWRLSPSTPRAEAEAFAASCAARIAVAAQ